MTAYAQYPVDELQTVGGNLKTIADKLNSSSRGADDVDGLAGDQSRIQDAVHGFRSEWKASVDKLKENIGTIGDVSQQIGQLAGSTDDQLAKAMSPGSQA